MRQRVPGQGGVDIPKDAGAGHKGFAGAALFAGAAIVAHRSGKLVFFENFFSRYGCRQGTDAEQVMAAAMAVASFDKGDFFSEAVLLAQTGQGVIFAEKRNDWRAAAKGGDKGSGQIGYAGFDGEAFLR